MRLHAAAYTRGHRCRNRSAGSASSKIAIDGTRAHGLFVDQVPLIWRGVVRAALACRPPNSLDECRKRALGLRPTAAWVISR